MATATIEQRPGKTLPYYSFDTLLSRNAVYNIVVGARGLGKTYGAKKLMIRAYLTKGYQFIYLRRYKPELAGRGTFFADIAHEFPDYIFRVQGREAQVCRDPDVPEKEREWETMGWFVALSTAQSQKSVAYPDVRWILFDEFIIEKGALHYLPDETKAFMDFYSTVDRWKDKTRVIFCANSLSIMNPYFISWNIRPAKDNEMIVKADGFIAAHFPDSKDFANEVYETKFGAFIKDTDYGNFSVKSEFKDNTDVLVAAKTADASYQYTLITKNGTFSVWISFINQVWFLQDKRPGDEIKYTTEPTMVDRDVIYMERNNKLLGALRGAYARGRAFFSSPQVREAFVEVFKK